jgi:hypothetical protein
MILLFTKREHAHKLLSGEKWIELRAGDRYRNVLPGHRLSINGQFYLTVTKRFIFTTKKELTAFMRNEFRGLGFPSYRAARLGLDECYKTPQFPMFAWCVKR